MSENKEKGKVSFLAISYTTYIAVRLFTMMLYLNLLPFQNNNPIFW